MTKQFIGAVVVFDLVAAGWLSIALAKAQTEPFIQGPKITIEEKVKAGKDAVQERIIERKNAAEEKRTVLEQKAEERKVIPLQEKKAALKIKAEERKAMIQEKRAAVQERVKTKKEELKTKREERKEELKNRLQTIKDEKKKAAVERLDKKIEELNTKLTNHWLNALKRLEDLLGKVSLRADKAEAAGRNVSSVRALAEKAHSAIAASREALAVQLSKTYSFEITDESTLGVAVSAARTALNNDLKSVKETVQIAHKAVVETIKALKGVPNVDEVEQK
jgi:chromosome segregation ATPase